MTNIRLSSQQTNSMHKASSQLLGTGSRAQLPSPARTPGGGGGEEVVKVHITAITGLSLLSSERRLAGLPDAGFF